MEQELLENIEQWHQENAHSKIIAMLSQAAWQDLDYESTGLLARAYNNIGQYSKAINRLRNVAAEGVNDPLWHFRLGYAYFYDGDYTEALKALTQVLALDGDHQEAQELLKRTKERLNIAD